MSDLDICRICLIHGVNGHKLTDKLKSFYEDLLNVKINDMVKDELPKWVCYECAALLQKFYKFKQKCIRGQSILTAITWNEPITITAIAKVNRLNEFLHSTICLTACRNKNVRTYNMKHSRKRKPLHLEEIIVDFEENTPKLMKHDESPAKDVIETDKEQSTPINENDIATNENDILNNENDILTNDNNILPNDNNILPNDNNILTNDKINNDDIDITANDNDMPANDDHHNSSSDDENIFLDIVKKAVSGQNKLVFIDHLSKKKSKVKKKRQKSQIKKKSSKSHPKRFEKQKKEILSAEYWQHIKLSEDEAMAEFKKKEFSSKYVNASYKCHNCFKGFSKLDIMDRHIKLRHANSGKEECRFCKMRFRVKCQMAKHLQSHFTIYQCLRCDMKFNLFSSAQFHEEYHSGAVKTCKHCGETFKHNSTYYTHMRMRHRSAHLCSFCGTSFVSAAGLSQHMKLKHFDTKLDIKATEDNYCAKCDVVFASQTAYDEHLVNSNMHEDCQPLSEFKRRNVKGGKEVRRKNKLPTTCVNCGKKFPTQSACMKHHLAEHPRKPFHSQDQRHICEICGASLAAVSIASHMNTHTREHIYSCDVCGMQFTSKSSHQRHQITHTGERPFGCPLCDKRFTQRGSMLLHYRTFHLKQPYPKRNRRKKTDEIPLVEAFRDRSDESSTGGQFT